MRLANWRWPQFSLAEILATAALFAAIWGFVAVRDREGLPETVASSGVLLWFLFCWKFVRANRRGKK
jgi:hypothetical protein